MIFEKNYKRRELIKDITHTMVWVGILILVMTMDYWEQHI